MISDDISTTFRNITMSKTLSLKQLIHVAILLLLLAIPQDECRLFHRNNYIYVVRSRQSVLPKRGSIWFIYSILYTNIYEINMMSL